MTVASRSVIKHPCNDHIRPRCPWAVSRGALIAVRASGLRNLDGCYINMDHPLAMGDLKREVFGTVIGRHDGSSDWCVVHIMTERGVYCYHLSSANPVGYGVQIIDDPDRIAS